MRHLDDGVPRRGLPSALSKIPGFSISLNAFELKGAVAVKNRNWTNRTLWFLLGLVMAGVMTFVSPSRGEPVQDYYQELALLKQRVSDLEQYNKRREKAEIEAAKQAAKQAERDARAARPYER